MSETHASSILKNLYATAYGAVNAYKAYIPSIDSLQEGLYVNLKINADNTGSSTLDINSFGSKSIKSSTGSDLASSDLSTDKIVALVYNGSEFQILAAGTTNSSMSSVDNATNKNTSNHFRTLDVLQSQHTGETIIESGWVDSFGNANEIGADEANSIGESYDNVNKLYEGSTGSINQNSDKDYTTESNYLQQEWTNSNQSTSQATVASGTTVTLSSGVWPTNAESARISFDSGSTFFDIDSRDSDTQLTLASSATNATSDYIIRMSAFDSGEVKFNLVESGSGLDTTSGKTYSAGNANGSFPASKAFDDLTGNNQAYVANSPTDWIKIDFGSGQSITPIKYTMICWNGDSNRNQNESPKTWTFEGSNDDSNWTVLDTQTNVPTWSNLEKRTYTFINSVAYRYLRWDVTANQGFLDRMQMTELEIIESASSNSINEYVSIVDTFAQKEDTSSWSDINSASRTETLNSQNAYYWLSYDPASGYGDGTEVKVFNQSGSVWRKIARNNAGTWQYNNDATNTATENWTNATTNDMLHAVSQAMSSQANNRMTGAELAAITDAEWEAANGFSTSVNSLARGVTLHSTSSTQNPSVDQYRINYDSDNVAMDLRSKTFDPGSSPASAFIWAKVEHTDVDGAGTFSISRNGGSNWETVSMVQQGEAISGDVRILRSVHTFTTGSGGEDLRARYVTEAGKPQKLHAWGLQARD